MYKDELIKAMEWLGKKPKTMFLGQGCVKSGHFMAQTLKNVFLDKCLEFPVVESLQMQFSLGLAIKGYCPISIYPRQNFLLLGVADMVLIDKINHMSVGSCSPHLIIRSSSGPDGGVFPGIQHVGNFSEAFKTMLKWIKVVELNKPEQVFPAYQQAYNYKGTTLILEDGNRYYD